MGAREEREKARAFIAGAKGAADTSAMAARIAQLEAMVERLSGAAAGQGGAAVADADADAAAVPQVALMEDGEAESDTAPRPSAVLGRASSRRPAHPTANTAAQHRG
jgi:hypothetical protein